MRADQEEGQARRLAPIRILGIPLSLLSIKRIAPENCKHKILNHFGGITGMVRAHPSQDSSFHRRHTPH